MIPESENTSSLILIPESENRDTFENIKLHESYFDERIDLLDYKIIVDNPLYKSYKLLFKVYAFIHLFWNLFELTSFFIFLFKPEFIDESLNFILKYARN